MAFELDPARSALIIQDLQNDVIAEGGAFADSGAPAHAQSQNVVENVKSLAARRASRHGGDPRPLHRRGRGAGAEAERAALPGCGRGQGDGARHLGGRGGGRA